MGNLTKRLFMTGALCALALPAFAQSGPLDPWSGRRLMLDEYERLRSVGERLVTRAGTIPGIRHKMLQDHFRMTIPAHLLFPASKDNLTEPGVMLVTAICEELTRAKDVRVEIVTHHHQARNSYMSFVTTERRSTSVRAAMMSRGVEGDRLKATGLGDRFPIASNTDDLGRTSNRRTDLLIRPL